MIGEINVIDHARVAKRSETLCQVWAITNWLYIEMQGPIID